MRHRVYGKHLGRDKNQRTALFRGLTRSLILQGHITTTEAKAKAIKGLLDRLISKSRENTPASRRVVESAVPQKEVSKKLFEETAPSFPTRTSGFTRMVRLGIRAGDGAMMVRMSLISDKSAPIQSGSDKIGGSEKEEAKENKTGRVPKEKTEIKPGRKKK